MVSPLLLDKVSKLPEAPGVYRMLDADGLVLYVGKATNLKKRVSSYFKKHSHVKTSALLEKIVTFDVTVTASETEALLLEMRLIKSLMPKYNVLLRDDKSYPWIYMSDHPYPRIDSIRFKTKPLKGTYFGPYPHASAVLESIDLIQKLFKLRTCKDHFFLHRSRPCLQYQLNRCTAPCTGLVSKEGYKAQVSQAIAFLKGDMQAVFQKITRALEDAVSRLAFEEAASLRDTLQALRIISEKQGMIALKARDLDVIVYEVHQGFGAISHTCIREGAVRLHTSFFPEVPNTLLFDDERSLECAVFETFLMFYYGEGRHEIPSEILLETAPQNHVLLEAMLTEWRGKSCRFLTNPRGIKKRWLEFTIKNLSEAVLSRHLSEAVLVTRYQALQHVLGLSQIPKRIECFDISHHQGKSTVASMVVFDKKGPLKKAYRHFYLDLATPGDDLLAMKTVLARRFRDGMQQPDLLIIDGGRSQVEVADAVLRALQIEGVSLIGIVKDPSRKSGLEKLVLASQNFSFLTLGKDSDVLHFLLFIRDEAHRFALKGHRQRSKRQNLVSALEDIPGVGKKKRQALLVHFGGISELRHATLEAIMQVPGISRVIAQRVYTYFH